MQAKTALRGCARAAPFLINLFSFEAIATGTAFRITVAGVPYVDFTQGAVIPCAVELTFRNATADSGVYFITVVFVHHVFKLLFYKLRKRERKSAIFRVWYKEYAQISKRLLTFYKFCGTI